MLRIFSDAAPENANQRPDILLRNPRGFGRQVILDVAVTVVKVNTAMKWWSKCQSMIIAKTKTASRNVAFKAAKISEVALAVQSSVLTREVEGQRVESVHQRSDVSVVTLVASSSNALTFSQPLTCYRFVASSMITLGVHSLMSSWRVCVITRALSSLKYHFAPTNSALCW